MEPTISIQLLLEARNAIARAEALLSSSPDMLRTNESVGTAGDLMFVRPKLEAIINRLQIELRVIDKDAAEPVRHINSIGDVR